MPLPGGAQLINTHEDLLTAFSNIDQRLHRIIGGDEVPYIYRNKLYLPASMYSIHLAAIGSGGQRNTMADGLGSLQSRNTTLEGTTSTIATRSLDMARTLWQQHTAADAAGTIIQTSIAWEPIASVVGASTVITADGAGNIGAEAAVLAAGGGATTALDAWMICQVDTTGSYQTQWGQDATGTFAPTTPDYHTANHIAYMVAGYPYILRMRTVTDNVNIGYGIGTNGEWPNSANMYITGWYRLV